MIDVQDSHRQKNWATEQKEKDMNRQPDHMPPNPQDANSHAQVQPVQQERSDHRAAGPPASESLMERGRILKHDAEALTSSVRESAELFNRYVTEQVEQRPYTTVAIAAGLGFMLGGGLANRITGTALGAAYRLGLALAARELSARMSIPGVTEESSRQEGSTR